MNSQWRYAPKPLPVDPAARNVAALMLQGDAEAQPSSIAEATVEERMHRIVRGLRARVTEPEVRDQRRGPDDDPSTRD